MYMVFISATENINRLDELRTINEKLALNPGLSAAERESCINKGRVFLAATLSMHSSEVGPSQAAPLIAYDLATTRD